jgi:hypothetical protein
MTSLKGVYLLLKISQTKHSAMSEQLPPPATILPGQRQCRYCQKVFKQRGIGSHEKSCKSRPVASASTPNPEAIALQQVLQRENRAGIFISITTV